jgi:hypothetical protein
MIWNDTKYLKIFYVNETNRLVDKNKEAVYTDDHRLCIY